mgnify:CR=1 FL=1
MHFGRRPRQLEQHSRIERTCGVSIILRCALAAFSIGIAAAGCAQPTKGPTVIYLEGAGWYTSGGGVEAGLRDAGYTGEFSRFTWTSFLGPAHDHFVNARSRGIARRLARRIEAQRRKEPDAPIHVMGLSAGTSLVLMALPMLPEDIQVDSVVLFSPSVSSEHNLTEAMKHVRRNLYATSSPYDGILAGLPVNADGKGGAPAGRYGFRMPPRAKESTLMAYSRVINLPWNPSYLAYGWNGSHTGVTNRRFVKAVIAPRILTNEPFPLDRSILDRAAASPSGGPR